MDYVKPIRRQWFREYTLPADVLFLVPVPTERRGFHRPAFTLRRSFRPGQSRPARNPRDRSNELARGPTYAAECLDSGDHWHVVRSLSEFTSKTRCALKILVCSAGYGRSSASARISPYSATFTSNHPDSVVQTQTNGKAVARPPAVVVGRRVVGRAPTRFGAVDLPKRSATSRRAHRTFAALPGRDR